MSAAFCAAPSFRELYSARTAAPGGRISIHAAAAEAPPVSESLP